MRSDLLVPERPRAHVTTFVGRLRVADDDALLQARGVLEAGGQRGAGARFQAQAAQSRIGRQAGDGGIVPHASEKFGHQRFPEGILRICREGKRRWRIRGGLTGGFGRIQ